MGTPKRTPKKLRHHFQTSDFFEQTQSQSKASPGSATDRPNALSSKDLQALLAIKKEKHQMEEKAPSEAPKNGEGEASKDGDGEYISPDAVALKMLFKDKEPSLVVEKQIQSLFRGATLELRGYHKELAEGSSKPVNDQHESSSQGRENAKEHRQEALPGPAEAHPKLRGGGGSEQNVAKGSRFSELINETEDETSNGDTESQAQDAEPSRVNLTTASCASNDSDDEENTAIMVGPSSADKHDHTLEGADASNKQVRPVKVRKSKSGKREKTSKKGLKDQKVENDTAAADPGSSTVRIAAQRCETSSSNTATKTQMHLKDCTDKREAEGQSHICMSEREIVVCLNVIKARNEEHLRTLEISESSGIEKCTLWSYFLLEELLKMAAERKRSANEEDFYKCLRPHLASYSHRLLDDLGAFFDVFDKTLIHEKRRTQHKAFEKISACTREEVYGWSTEICARCESQYPGAQISKDSFIALYKGLYQGRLNDNIARHEDFILDDAMSQTIDDEVEARSHYFLTRIQSLPSPIPTDVKEGPSSRDAPSFRAISKALLDKLVIKRLTTDGARGAKDRTMSAEDMALLAPQVMTELGAHPVNRRRAGLCLEVHRQRKRDFVIRRYEELATERGQLFRMKIFERWFESIPTDLDTAQPRAQPRSGKAQRHEDLVDNEEERMSAIEAIFSTTDVLQGPPIAQTVLEDIFGHDPRVFGNPPSAKSETPSQLRHLRHQSPLGNEHDDRSEINARNLSSASSEMTTLLLEDKKPYDPLLNALILYQGLSSFFQEALSNDADTLPTARNTPINWPRETETQSRTTLSVAITANTVPSNNVVLLAQLLVPEIAALSFHARSFNLEKRFGLYPERASKAFTILEKEHHLDDGEAWSWWPRSRLEVLDDPSNACVEYVTADPKRVPANLRSKANPRRENKKKKKKTRMQGWEDEVHELGSRIGEALDVFDAHVRQSRRKLAKIERERKEARAEAREAMIEYETCFWKRDGNETGESPDELTGKSLLPITLPPRISTSLSPSLLHIANTSIHRWQLRKTYDR